MAKKRTPAQIPARSREFLDCLRRRVQSVTDPEHKADILKDIRTAADHLEE